MKTIQVRGLVAAVMAIGSTAVLAAVPVADGTHPCTDFSFSGLAGPGVGAAQCYGSIKPPPGDSSVDVINEIVALKGWGYVATTAYKDDNALGGASDTFLIDANAATRSVTFSQAISGAFALVLKTGSDWSVFNFSSGVGAGTLSYSIANAGGYQGLGLSHATVYAGAITPVPEPETYVLMLAGVGVVGFVARRRRPRN